MMQLDWDNWSTTLQEAIAKVIERGLSPETSAEQIMEILDQAKLVVYSKPGRGHLLSPQGRMLIAVMERPDATIRELGAMTGVSEAHAGRTMRFLTTKGFVTRTKRGRGYVLEVSAETLLSHPEIVRLAEILFIYAEKWLSEQNAIPENS